VSMLMCGFVMAFCSIASLQYRDSASVRAVVEKNSYLEKSA
jgi:hypothetical protein